MTAPVLCEHCHRRIQPGSPYHSRKVGPKCGGRIRKGRRPAVRGGPPAEAGEEQGALFEMEDQ